MAKLSEEALDFFRKAGAKGGKARKRKLTEEQRKDQARKAAETRWARVRAAKGKGK